MMGSVEDTAKTTKNNTPAQKDWQKQEAVVDDYQVATSVSVLFLGILNFCRNITRLIWDHQVICRSQFHCPVLLADEQKWKLKS